MMIVKNLKKMSEFSSKQKRLGKKVGFVPTMGALHNGHLSLIRKSRQENGLTIVSIFVNPSQFGPGEDLKKYPRDLKKDSVLCAKEKVDVIFYPSPKEIYPQGFKTYVYVEGLSDKLCGRSRPGHFRGVATVVAKLFNIVRPDSAYFGLKDAQQAIILKQMSEDLNFPVQIRLCPTKREKDGLAMSSRNVYLDKSQRTQAVALSQSLKLAQDLIKNGQSNSKIIISSMRNLINRAKDARIDYISVTDIKELKPLKKIKGEVLISLAVHIGRTRLIDNCILKVRN